MLRFILFLFGLFIGLLLIVIGLAVSGVMGSNVDGNTDGDTSPVVGAIIVLLGIFFCLAPLLKSKKKE
jgi:hypothetical protein